MKHNNPRLKPISGFSIVLLMVAFSINTAFAVASTPPPGTPVVYPTITQTKASLELIGGSTFPTTWTAPATATYKVFVQIPTTSTATNATYFIYPKGRAVGDTVCSSTAPSYPCFKVIVDQATATNGWAQLMVNNQAATTWKFNKLGYVSVNTNAISSSEQLGVAEVAFQQVIAPPPLTIGQNYQGGKIAYLDSTKQHGLIAASTDQSSGIQWLNGFNQATGATGKAIGTGQANTTAIVTALGAGGYAAKLCDDLVLGGYTDWYLPSLNELNKLYKNKSVLGGFAKLLYWSSTEFDSDYAKTKYFLNGSQSHYSKSLSIRVRAVRAF